MKLALSAVLVSPHFLFRVEQDDPAGSRRQPPSVDDYELATRLSYFLWSSMPDDELFSSAACGEAARRERAGAAGASGCWPTRRRRRSCTNFVGQWLELRNLDESTPDSKRVSGVRRAAAAAMRREAELFFENLIREDRSVLELLDCDYTFVNERLAKHYGIAGVKGGRSSCRVSLAGTPRGGVLTMAGVLTVTAMPSRTSPVKRGKFVLEQMLGTPPPPPPADVPALADAETEVQAASLRERLETHRATPELRVPHADGPDRLRAGELRRDRRLGRGRRWSCRSTPAGKLPEGSRVRRAGGTAGSAGGRRRTISCDAWSRRC